MGHYTGKKNRIARRFRVNIFGRARNPLLHKPNPPGVQGLRRRKKSDYGLALEEKQKLKALYGMLREKQLVNYYKRAAKQGGNVANHLIQMLECRLDNLVYRLGFGSTVFAAHQLVSHGHILVDGKRVDIRSFQVKPGQVISIREKSRKMKSIQEALTSGRREVPPYLTVDAETFTGSLVHLPNEDEIPHPIEVDLHEICDFLAHTT